MDFREIVASEASEGFGQLLARRSERHIKELAEFRKALDDALSAVESTLNDDGARDETEIASFVDRLAAAVAAQVRMSTAQAQVEAQEKFDALVAASQRETDAAYQQERETRKTLEDELHALRAELDRTRDESATLTQRLELAGEERRFLESALRETEGRLERATAQHEDHGSRVKQLEQANRESEDARRELHVTLDQLRAQADILQDELEGERVRSATAVGELTRLRDAVAEAATTVQEAQALQHREREARTTVEDQLDELRSALDRSRTELARSSERLEVSEEERRSFESALRQAEAQLESLTAQHDASAARFELLERANREKQNETLSGTRLSDGASGPLAFDQLLAVYQNLERGTSIAAVLTSLANGLHGPFPCVALFSVKENGLEGVYQVGFDIKRDIHKLVIPWAVDSVLTRAVISGCIETPAPSDPADAGLPFGGTSGSALALPVAVNGSTIAVVYAEDGEVSAMDAAAQASRVKFAELLRRQTVPILKRLTIDEKALAELRDYASLLLEEVEQVYAADVRSGMQNGEVVERLTANLRYAQEAYARRLASAPVAELGVDLFSDRLTALIEAKATLPFGRHLAIASSAAMKVDASLSQPVAEAS